MIIAIIRKLRSQFALSIVWLMPESHSPARNPPRCPKQSMLLAPTDVKRIVKTISIPQAHNSWHLRIAPIFFNPDQLIIKQPIMTPNTPYRQVDAPAFTVVVLQTAEKMLPAIAEIMYMMMQRIVPNVYQNRDRRMTVLIKLPKKCIKFTCKTAAVISLHTWPFLTRSGSLAPIMMSLSGQISKSSPALSKPIAASAMNIAIQAISMKAVKEKHLKTGQHISINMSRQFSSRGFFIFLLPDKNRTLYFYTFLRCSMLMPSRLVESEAELTGLDLRLASLLPLLNP